MRIEIRARNVKLTEGLREHIRKLFAPIGKQVSDLALLEVELYEERNPAIADSQVADANLHVKGTTLHASERSPEMLHSVKALAKDMRRQVKRHRELRRKRTRTRRLVARARRGTV